MPHNAHLVNAQGYPPTPPFATRAMPLQTRDMPFGASCAIALVMVLLLQGGAAGAEASVDATLYDAQPVCVACFKSGMGSARWRCYLL